MAEAGMRRRRFERSEGESTGLEDGQAVKGWGGGRG